MPCVILNFEETDRGIVVTVNADVADQGPFILSSMQRTPYHLKEMKK